MNDERSQFSVTNDIVNDKKGHNIVNDNRFAISQTAYLFRANVFTFILFSANIVYIVCFGLVVEYALSCF